MPWRRHSDYDDYGYYPRSSPRKAKGGIKAQTRRGGFGKSWWGKRWIEVLESFDIGARLGRGRRYARQGQVLNIDVDRELVTAEVQGSRAKPYKVMIRVKALARPDWERLAQALALQALFAAKLLAGEMPPDIETVFADVGLSLFPERLKDLDTACSCPDWSNPCKHVAAVYYLLGEEFDRDPFLIFRLRGIDRDELVQLLGGSQPEPTGEEPPAVAPGEPLPPDPVAFWERRKTPEDLFGEVRVPTLSAALVRRLGAFPFWRAHEPFLDAVALVYPPASEAGIRAFLAETEDA